MALVDRLRPAIYPPVRPQILSNLGFELIPFNYDGICGYSVHRTGAAPAALWPVKAKHGQWSALPAPVPSQCTFRNTKVLAFERARFMEKMGSGAEPGCDDPFIVARLASAGLLTHPQDVWEILCGYETKHAELQQKSAKHVGDLQLKIKHLQAEVLKVCELSCPYSLLH